MLSRLPGILDEMMIIIVACNFTCYNNYGKHMDIYFRYPDSALLLIPIGGEHMSSSYISESNFIVRKSGQKENSFYIDYLGIYKVVEISKLVHLDASFIREKYAKYGAEYCDKLDLYYFNSIDQAKSAINDILRSLKPDQKGRIIQLTEAEIEYIRQALINEGVNNLRVNSKVKDNIFKKLNS